MMELMLGGMGQLVFLELFWSWISMFPDGGFSNVKRGVLPSRLGSIDEAWKNFKWTMWLCVVAIDDGIEFIMHFYLYTTKMDY